MTRITKFMSCALTAAMSVVLNAQTLVPLHRFTGADGAGPRASLIQSADGGFYGTTAAGGLSNSDFCGSSGCGTIFKVTPSGAFTTLHQFCSQTLCADGALPGVALVQGANGNFYGTTSAGGQNQSGAIFEVTATGAFAILHNFCSEIQCTDGEDPDASLTRGTDGNFYGTTYGGGSHGGGTVFSVTPTGTLTTLYSFCSQPACADGSGPSAALIRGADGNFYGTNQESGVGESGTIFSVTSSGVLTTLHSFNPSDGQYPVAGLFQANDGTFYGTVPQGGAHGGGTVFRVTTSGTFTKLYDFCSQASCSDGSNPYASLIQATDGNFYGTTFSGGTSSRGTVFQITPTGILTTLYRFCQQTACMAGSGPFAGLIQAALSGRLYGTAQSGGTNNDGTVFTLPLP